MADTTTSREQIIGLRAQLDTVLGRIEQTLETEAFVADLPIVGTSLAAAYQQGQAELRSFERLITGLSSVLQALTSPPTSQMADPSGGSGGMYTLNAVTPGPLASQVASALNTEIANRGFSGVANVTSDSAGVLYLNLSTSYHPAAYVQNLSTTLGTGMLGLRTQGSATLTLGYDLNVTFAVDALGNNSGTSGTGFKATIDTSNITFNGAAILGPARFQATDLGSGIHGAFTILTDGSPATFTGTADLDIHLQGDLGTAALPSISTDLDIAWALNNAATGPTSTGPFGTVPTVSFNNVTWDLGQFFDNVMKPALDAIRPLVAPVRTVLNILSTDLVVIKSILGYGWHLLDTAGNVNAAGQVVGDGKVTLLDLIHIGSPGADLAGVTKAIGVINAITTVVEALELLNDATAYYNLGSFTFNADVRQAAFVLAQAVPVVTQPAQNLANALQGLANGQTSAANVATVATTLTQLTTAGNSIYASGLSQGPAFAALLGGRTDLFRVDVPDFTIGFGSVNAAGAPTSTVNLGFYPLVPFIDVSLDAALQATVKFDFGYDTSGLAAYANGNFSDPSQALNGLWISNPDDVLGDALLRIAGSVGFNVNAGVRPVAQISGGGDIGGEIEFFLPQAGRNYLSDLQRYVQNGTFFATRGALTAGFNASVNVINPIGGGTIRLWDAHSDRLTLASYNQLTAPLPASAPTAVSVDVLRLNDILGKRVGILVPDDNAKIRVQFDLPVDVRGTPTLTLDDGGTAVFDGAATLALGDAYSLVFRYVVQPTDTSTPALTVLGVGGGGTMVEAGVPDGLPARSADVSVIDKVVLNDVRVDTAITRTFIQPTGDAADESRWDIPFITVSGQSTQTPGGQALSINYYGNAVIAAGNAATFGAGIAKAESAYIRSGATLTIAGGTVDVTGSYKQDILVQGTVLVLGGSTLRTDDDVSNTGLLALGGSSGQQASWEIGKALSLTGGGTVRLGNDDANRIIAKPRLIGANDIASVLSNRDNRIEGAGAIGSTQSQDDALIIDNYTAGTVMATGTRELRILNPLNNSGLLGAVGQGAGTTPTGGLHLFGDLYNYTSDPAKGTLSATLGGLVTLDDMDVTAGTLMTTDTGTITTAGSVTLDGASAPITLQAKVVAGAGSTLTAKGTFTQAAFAENPANGARLSAGTGTLVLDGASITDGLIASAPGGTVHVTGNVTLTGTVLPASAPGLVTAATLVTDTGSSLRMAGAVANRGAISGAAGLQTSGAFDNSGSVAAASIAATGLLTNTGSLAAVGDLSSNGTFNNLASASAGGSFRADGGFVNQGTVSAASVQVGGTSSNTNQITATGGVGISGSFGNAGTVSAGGSVSLSGAIGNHGTIAGASAALSGTIDNTSGILRVANGGAIDVSDGTTIKGGTLRAAGGTQADAAMIRVSGAVTLDGTGEQVNNFGVLTAGLVSDVHGNPLTSRTLHLTGLINQYSNPALAGEIVANNEDVVLDNATLQNGTLRTVGSGRFVLDGSSVLDGTNYGLTVPGQLVINVGQTPAIRGLIVNAVSMSLDGNVYYGTSTLRVSGTATLAGGGTVRLRDTSGNNAQVSRVVGATGADTLVNQDNVITGYGLLGMGSLAFVNQAAGVVTATDSSLVLYGAAGSANRGLLQAATGRLVIETALANAGGRILASGNTVELGGDGRAATIAGGTLQSAGTNVVLVTRDGATFDGTQERVANTGTVALTTEARLTTMGSLVNSGVLTLDGNVYYGTATLRSVGQTTLTGGGTVRLRDTSGNNYAVSTLTGASAGDVLENVDNTITGYGELGAGQLTFVNQASGTVTATTGTLRLFTGVGPVNRGLMQATSGTLLIESTVDNAGGRIAAAGGTVQLGGEGRVGRITGGSMSSSASSRFVVDQAVLDGSGQAVTTSASIGVGTGNRLTLTGAIANAGAVALDGNVYYGTATLGVTGTARLTGGGTVTLRDTSGNNYGVATITGANTEDVLDNVDNTITGYGQLGAGRMRFINEAAGVVRGTTATFTIDTGTAAIVNRGLFEAAGGTLALNSDVTNIGVIRAAAGGSMTLRTTVENSGSIVAADTGVLVLDGGTVRGSGRLGSTGLGTVRVTTTGTIDGAGLATELVGTLNVIDGAALTLKSGISNGGTVSLDGNVYYGTSTLRVSGTATLAGGGTVRLRDTSGNNAQVSRVVGATGADTLVNQDNVITGYGLLGMGSLAFVNQAAGVVTATDSSLVLYGAAGSANRGLLQAATGRLVIETALANAGGRILASGNTVELGGDGRAATIAGGTLQSAGTNVVLVTRDGATFDGTQERVANTGTVALTTEARLTTMGSLVNSGVLTLDGNVYYGTATLRSVGQTTLTGGGTVRLRDTSGNNYAVSTLTGASAGDVLENVDNTITGYGELGAGQLTFVNQASGTVTATTGTLRLFTGVGPVNRGLMQATSGTLLIESTVDNAGGRIAAAGGTVQLGGEGRVGRITGGSMSSSASSRFVVDQAVLDGSGQAVTTSASIGVGTGNRLTLTGAIANAGAVALDGNVYYGTATLGVTGTARLTGGGTVTLQDTSGNNYGVATITGASTEDVLDNVDNTITGYGQLGAGKLRFINEAAGTVRATTSTLAIDTGTETVVNLGMLVADGGALTVAGGVTNSGLIEAKSSAVTLGGRVTGGTLQVDAGQRMTLAGGMAGSTLRLEGTGSTVSVGAGQSVSGTVYGLDDGDVFDLAGVSATGTYAGGVLTLRSGDTMVGNLAMGGATASDTFVAVSNGAGGTRIMHQTITPPDSDIRFTNVVTNTSGRDASETYSGPVDYLRHQYIWASQDIVAMSANAPSTFIKGGPGGDAILVTGGQNVLDGGGGSNFLIGGDGSDGGKDVFFVDSREELETWSTIVNFHKGDLATIFGFRDGISTRPYTDVDGAPGFTGVTIHSEINGPGTGIKGSMTFAGIDRATADAHFEITTGTLPGDIGYMLIEYK